MKPLVTNIVIAGIVLATPTGWAKGSEVSDYPLRPINLIVPFSPGGGIDILGRIIGQELSERLDVPVVIENKPGASGNIGTQFVAAAKPDGYTLLITANTITMTPHLFSVQFDPIKDFKSVSHVAVGNLGLVLGSKFEAEDFNELVDLAKKQPGKLNYSSPGVGTPHHLAMELVSQKAGMELQHIPYTGSAGALNDLVAGRVDFGFMPVHQVKQQVKAGQLSMLTAGALERTVITPETPSLAEASGLSDVDVDMWYGLYAPSETPEPIVKKLNKEIVEILNLDTVQKHLLQQGLIAKSSTSQLLADLTKSDFEKWGKLIKESSINVD